MKLDKKTLKTLLNIQKNEITEHYIYKNLAKTIKEKQNKEILQHIAEDELNHYHFWEKYTEKKVKPNKFKIWFYYWIARIFGLVFGLKLMEEREEKAQQTYRKLEKKFPDSKKVIDEEHEHEKELIKLIDEEKLKHIRSIVLGLNDALVELTGALAGFTFVFKSNLIIATAGLITGISASLSMAASEYISIKSEGESTHKTLRASVYTGTAYLATVILLVLPFFILKEKAIALILTLITAVIVIAVFNFYISVVKGFSFKKRFTEMASISLGVALISFAIGFIVRTYFNIEI